MRRAARFAALGALSALSACAGAQSALAPAGRDASALSTLFWVMLGGAVLLWVAVNGLMFYVTRLHVRPISGRLSETLIVAGGVVMPTVLLAGLLSYGLSIMPDQRAPGQGVRIEVTGHEWWWRVDYWPEGATEPVASANEVVLPAGQRTEIVLRADQVIHSFWIPALGGKTDMIPGRVNRMSLHPETPGVYRGQCAEFCGDSHALMALNAVVLSPEDHAVWLAAAAAPAGPVAGAEAERGRAVFLREGCGACHTVRGTEASGNVGPDLTHVGSRTTIGAGVLPVTVEAIARWVRDPEAFKPGVQMPGYDHLSNPDLQALAVWLEGLK